MEYYIALFSSETVEFNAESYKRKEVFFDFATGLNINAIQFPIPLEWNGWGVATHIAIFNRYADGNRLSLGIIENPITVYYGTVINIPVGSIGLVAPIAEHIDCCTEILNKLDACVGRETADPYNPPTLSNITANISEQQINGTPVATMPANFNATITAGTKPLTVAKVKINGILVSTLSEPSLLSAISYSHNDEITGTSQFTFEISDGRTTVSKNFNVVFKYEIFYGRGQESYSQSVAENSVLSDDTSITVSFGVNPVDNDKPYLWVCFPLDMNPLNGATDFLMVSNNFVAPFSGPFEHDSYRCYRSSNPVNGAVQIKS